MKSFLIFAVTFAATHSFAQVDCSIQRSIQGNQSNVVQIKGTSISSDAGDYQGYFVKLPEAKDYSLLIMKKSISDVGNSEASKSMSLQVMENYALNSWTPATREVSRIDSADGQTIQNEMQIGDSKYSVSCTFN